MTTGRDVSPKDCFDDGYPNFLLREKESHAGNSSLSAFGQFQNVIDIGVFPLD